MTTKKYELNDLGVAALMEEVIAEAKDDLIRAYGHFLFALRHSDSDLDTEQAIRMYRKARAFFFSPLFTAICPMDSADYVKQLIKEVKRQHDHHSSEDV